MDVISVDLFSEYGQEYRRISVVGIGGATPMVVGSRVWHNY